MKSKKIILTSHCIMNQNSVVEGLARARGAYPIIELLLSEGIGIMQLPCPEFIFKGINRPPLEYADYDSADYRKLSREILSPYIYQLKEYVANGYSFLGIIAVQNSPSCSISGRRGVFMEELLIACEREAIPLKYVEITETYNEHSREDALENKIIKLIKES